MTNVPNALTPRHPSLIRTLVQDHSRLRRLELQGAIVRTGLAIYETTYTDADATDNWTPVFSAATATLDTIGCTVTDSGLLIPPGWMWWGTANFAIATGAEPTSGDLVQFAVAYDMNDSNFAVWQSAPLTDSATDAPQQLSVVASGATPPGRDPATATADSEPFGLSTVSSALGTTFTPQSLQLVLTANRLPVQQAYGDDIGGG
jgi:hypothetical protein